MQFLRYNLIKIYSCVISSDDVLMKRNFEVMLLSASHLGIRLCGWRQTIQMSKWLTHTNNSDCNVNANIWHLCWAMYKYETLLMFVCVCDNYRLVRCHRSHHSQRHVHLYTLGWVVVYWRKQWLMFYMPEITVLLLFVYPELFWLYIVTSPSWKVMV